MHQLLIVGGIDDVIGEVDEKLSKAALRRSIVPQDRGEGGITKWLRKALPKGFASAGVVAKTDAS